MYRIYFVLLLSLLFTACDDSTSHHSHHDHGHSEVQTGGSVAPPSNPVSIIDGVTVVEMTGNDRMNYNLETFSVPAVCLVK